MREIKYRLWDAEASKMVYPTLVGDTFIFGGMYLEEIFDDDSISKMEYVGVQDKQNKKTYEEDIVEVSWNSGQYGHQAYVNGVYVVKKREDFNIAGGYGDFYLENGPSIAYIKNGRIIGNTFENPELIK